MQQDTKHTQVINYEAYIFQLQICQGVDLEWRRQYSSSHPVPINKQKQQQLTWKVQACARTEAELFDTEGADIIIFWHGLIKIYFIRAYKEHELVSLITVAVPPSVLWCKKNSTEFQMDMFSSSPCWISYQILAESVSQTMMSTLENPKKFMRCASMCNEFPQIKKCLTREKKSLGNLITLNLPKLVSLSWASEMEFLGDESNPVTTILNRYQLDFHSRMVHKLVFVKWC